MTSSSSTLNVSTFDSALAAGADRADDDATDDAPEEKNILKLVTNLNNRWVDLKTTATMKNTKLHKFTLLHDISFSPIAT